MFAVSRIIREVKFTLKFPHFNCYACMASIMGLSASSDPWTEDRANIIRDKLLFLWENDIATAMEFDGRYNGSYKDYLYDPDQRTYTKKIFANGKADDQFKENIRLHAVGFTPSKALRLAFHDCIPYKDGSKGCDGCLNWEGVGHRFVNFYLLIIPFLS